MKDDTLTKLILLAGGITWLLTGSLAGPISVLLAIAMFHGFVASGSRH